MTALNTEPSRVVYQGMLGTQNPQQFRFCSDPKTLKLDTPFGVPLAVDPTDKTKLIVPTATGAIIVGLHAANMFEELTTISGVMGGKAGLKASLMEIGEMYMFSEVAVNAYDPVFFRHTANGGNTILSRVRNAAGTGLDSLKGAMFAETITAPGLVLVSYRLPLPPT